MTGLNGCTFIDKTREPPNTYQECRDVVVIGEWTDRIYAHTPAEHIITNVVSGKYINSWSIFILLVYNMVNVSTTFSHKFYFANRSQDAGSKV